MILNRISFSKLYLFLILLVMGSCSSKKNTLFNLNKEIPIHNLPVYEVQKGSDGDYMREQVIQPGNYLLIRNLQNENLISGLSVQNGANSQNLSTGYYVESDSTVLLPVIGRIKLAGMSRMVAQQKLNELYQTNLLNNPIISLSITNLQVTFLGEFVSQGNYTLSKDQVHLVQALGDAGGLNPRANKRKIKIIRGNLSNPQVLVVNLEDINSLSDPRLFLRNNDIVYARPKGSFQILDRINPTSSLLGVGLSVLSIYLLISNLSK